MKHRFDLEIRILVEEIAPAIFRVRSLEVDSFAIVGQWETGARTIADMIRQQCESGNVRFVEPSAGLLVAWSESKLDEETAEACGVVYNGSLARVIHISAETQAQKAA